MRYAASISGILTMIWRPGGVYYIMQWNTVAMVREASTHRFLDVSKV